MKIDEFVEEHCPYPPGGYRGAWRKGAIACMEQKPITSCPYPDHRKASGRITWSRAWGRAWTDGYKACADVGRETPWWER